MSDLQDIIATTSIRAFKHGMKYQTERIIKLLDEHLGYMDWNELVKLIREESNGKDERAMATGELPNTINGGLKRTRS